MLREVPWVDIFFPFKGALYRGLLNRKYVPTSKKICAKKMFENYVRCR